MDVAYQKYVLEKSGITVTGTSLTVYPAASFIRYFNGRHTIVINKDPLSLRLNPQTDLEISAPIGEVFSDLKETF